MTPLSHYFLKQKQIPSATMMIASTPAIKCIGSRSASMIPAQSAMAAQIIYLKKHPIAPLPYLRIIYYMSKGKMCENSNVFMAREIKKAPLYKTATPFSLLKP